MIEEIRIGGVDITSNVLTSKFRETHDESIPDATIDVEKRAFDNADIKYGAKVTAKRGFLSLDEEFVFEGQVITVEDHSSYSTIEVKDDLYEAIKRRRVKSFDKNIDPEAGIGSEIMKDYITDSSLTYDDESVPTTGTEPDKLLDKVVQQDEHNYEKMKSLANHYNRSLKHIPGGHVEFKPKGFETYVDTLNDRNILNALDVTNDGRMLFNELHINGATVREKVVKLFTNTSTTFKLVNTPLDTEVRQDNETGTLYTRGVEGVTGDFDYTVDEDRKTITFDDEKTDIWIRYSANLPIPLVIRDNISIFEYGGEKQTPKIEILNLPEEKTKTDALRIGQEYINRHNNPLLDTEIMVTDAQIRKAYFKAGMFVNIDRPESRVKGRFLIKEVIKTIPHRPDTLVIGDRIWRLADWMAGTESDKERVFNTLRGQNDFLIKTFGFSQQLKIERRYIKIYKWS